MGLLLVLHSLGLRSEWNTNETLREEIVSVVKPVSLEARKNPHETQVFSAIVRP